MMTVYILNQNLLVAGLVEEYKSLIWNNRYWSDGDFELALPASADNIAMCQKGFYIIRTDDDMVGVIEKIEIDTDYDGENLLIVSGKDITSMFDRRVFLGARLSSPSTTIENYLLNQVRLCCINPTGWSEADAPTIENLSEYRKMKIGDATRLLIEVSVSFLPKKSAANKYFPNLGETIKELCQGAGYGYEMQLLSTGVFRFRLYNGIDRSNTVFFTPEYDNLSSSKYVTDSTNYKNVVYVRGNGTVDGSSRIAIYDTSDALHPVKSTERYEVYIDASKDVPRVVTVADIQEMFPGAHRLNNQLYAPNVSIQIYTPSQEEYLTEGYGGTVTEVDGNRFFNFTNETKVADLLDGSDAPGNRAAIVPIVYDSQLYAYAVDALASKKITTQFEGSVVPNVTYQYKRDYALGDIVTVRNEYGIEAQARIVEVLEVFDGNGYSIEPKFEYISG